MVQAQMPSVSCPFNPNQTNVYICMTDKGPVLRAWLPYRGWHFVAEWYGAANWEVGAPADSGPITAICTYLLPVTRSSE